MLKYAKGSCFANFISHNVVIFNVMSVGGLMLKGSCLVSNLLDTVGADVSLRSEGGMEPLHYAAEDALLRVIRYSIEGGADVNLQNEDGISSLHIVAGNGLLSVVRYLIGRGANINLRSEDGMSSLHYAAENGYLEVVRYLIERGADVNLQDRSGIGPLHIATENGYLEVVRYLIERGTNVNLQDRSGMGPLHCAAENGHLEVVRYLIERRADINLRNEGGMSPLHCAAENGYLEIVRYLIERGAGVNLQDRNGMGPLHYAARNEHLDVAKYFIEKVTNINLQDEGSMNSLHLNNVVDYPVYAKLFIKITLIKNFDKDYRKILNLDPYRDSANYRELLSYLDNCICEIMRMKMDRIDGNLSLYEFIITKEVNKKALYMNDEDVKGVRGQVFQVLNSANYPIYHDIISAKIEPSLERQGLLNELDELQVYTKLNVSNHARGIQEKNLVLDFDVKYEIARHLSNTELLNFILAFHRYTDQPSCLTRNFVESSLQPNTKLCEASTSSCAKHVKLK